LTGIGVIEEIILNVKDGSGGTELGRFRGLQAKKLIEKIAAEIGDANLSSK